MSAESNSNFYSNNQSGNYSQGQDINFTPSQENINIRTMQSDLEKIKEEGGNFPSSSFPQGNVSPENVSAEKNAYFETPNVQPTEMPSASQIPSPENLSFSPYQSEGTFPPGESSQEFAAQEPLPSTPKKSKLLLPLILALILLGIGIIGYFIIWPKISQRKAQVTPTTIPPTVLTTGETVPTTTTTTLPPSPFVEISGPYEKSIIEIKVIGEIIANALRKDPVLNSSAVGTFKVLIPSVKEILNTEQVILSLIPNLPDRLKKPLLTDNKYLVYAYYGEVNPSLGLIVEIDNSDLEEVKNIFLSWEKGKITEDLSRFVLVEMPKKITCKFKESELSGAKIRYCDFGTKEKGIGYAFFENYLIISSSFESLQSAINHLQGPREAIYPFAK